MSVAREVFASQSWFLREGLVGISSRAIWDIRNERR